MVTAGLWDLTTMCHTAERSSIDDSTTLWHDIRSLHARPSVAERIEFFGATVREIYERAHRSAGLSLPGPRCATWRGFATPASNHRRCRRHHRQVAVRAGGPARRRTWFRSAGSRSLNYWRAYLKLQTARTVFSEAWLLAQYYYTNRRVFLSHGTQN